MFYGHKTTDIVHDDNTNEDDSQSLIPDVGGTIQGHYKVHEMYLI